MDYSQAAALYRAQPTAQTLDRVCRELTAALTIKEKLLMLSGHFYLLKTLRDILLHHRSYNYSPICTGAVKRLGIPAVKFSDGPRGAVMGHSTCFPVSMARGASFDIELEAEIGRAIADEITARGANFFGGICINLLRNPRWGRAQESYGEDPYLLGSMGAALTRAVQGRGVMACVQHYACNSIENLRFKVNVTADERTLHEVYLPHFKACVDAGAVSVMGAYNKLRGEQCCESAYLLQDALRRDWGFEGFTVSDFMLGVRDAKKAIRSGLDIEMPMKYRYRALKRLLRSGDIEPRHIDEAAGHILAGMIKVLPPAGPEPENAVLSPAHKALALKAAQEGTVLLKNNGLLPLASGIRIAVIGRYADKPNTGDRGSSCVYSPHVVTPYEGLCRAFGRENVLLADGKNMKRDLPKIKACAAAVVCVGSDYKQEGEYLAVVSKSDKRTASGNGGDRYSLRIPPREVELIRAVCAVCPNTVVNITGGSAFLIGEWDEAPAAILHSFYAGIEGGNALADILCGKVNPSGKLPFTIARAEDDYPPFLFPGDKKLNIEYGYYHGYTLLDREKKKAAYPFGFGLSYTRFDFSALEVRRAAHGNVEVSVRVKNTGGKDGKTVVQVYAGSTEGRDDRPVKLLKGFQKIFLAAGEEKTAVLRLKTDDLRFYDAQNGNWVLDSRYRFYCGEDSEQAMGLCADIGF